MTMTLQEIMPAVRQLPAIEKIELLHFLEQEAETSQDTALFETGQTYYVFTPLEWSGVEILAEELSKLEAAEAQ